MTPDEINVWLTHECVNPGAHYQTMLNLVRAEMALRQAAESDLAAARQHIASLANGERRTLDQLIAVTEERDRLRAALIHRCTVQHVDEACEDCQEIVSLLELVPDLMIVTFAAAAGAGKAGDDE